jgi:hypothetical protein
LQPSIRFHFDRGPFLSPGCAIFRDGGRQSLEEQPTMDKVVSLLISVGIITFGAWVTAATIAKGLDGDGSVSTLDRIHQPLWFV